MCKWECKYVIEICKYVKEIYEICNKPEKEEKLISTSLNEIFLIRSNYKFNN